LGSTGTVISLTGRIEIDPDTTVENMEMLYHKISKKIIFSYQRQNVAYLRVGVYLHDNNIYLGNIMRMDTYKWEFNTMTQLPDGRIVFAHGDPNDNNYGKYAIGTLKGDVIVLTDDLAVFQPSESVDIALTSIDTLDKAVILYRDGGDTNNGKSRVLTPPGSTSSSFIGFSNAAYTNGQTATIQLVGSIDDAQSGLTTSRRYFVQTDGTLGLTPDDPNVFAGTALSGTQIIVKG
jgi:hypothetical protein